MLKEHVQLVLPLKMIFYAFHKIHWQHFSGVVDRFRNTCVVFLQDSVYQKMAKITHISLFLTELFKKINVATFLEHSVSVGVESR